MGFKVYFIDFQYDKLIFFNNVRPDFRMAILGKKKWVLKVEKRVKSGMNKNIVELRFYLSSRTTDQRNHFLSTFIIPSLPSKFLAK